MFAIIRFFAFACFVRRGRAHGPSRSQRERYLCHLLPGTRQLWLYGQVEGLLGFGLSNSGEAARNIVRRQEKAIELLPDKNFSNPPWRESESYRGHDNPKCRKLARHKLPL